MLQELDEWIIGRLERGCHRVQMATGLTSLRLATFVAMAQSVVWIVLALVGTFFLFRIMGALAVIFPIAAHLSYHRMDEHYRSGSLVAHPMTLYFRSRWRGRMILILALPCLLSLLPGIRSAEQYSPGITREVILFLVASTISTLRSYLEYTIPLPPGRTKIQELRDRFAAFFQRPIPVPTSK